MINNKHTNTRTLNSSLHDASRLVPEMLSAKARYARNFHVLFVSGFVQQSRNTIERA
jgi:hypothetical protein